MINIIVAEDHYIVRTGVISLLEQEKTFTITGEATKGEDVISLLTKGVKADIILADLNMPGMGGMELTEHIKANYPAIKVIILSALDQEKYVIKAFQMGACGYLLKSVGPDEMIFAIKHTHRFNRYICADLSSMFLNRLVSLPDPVNHENVSNLDFSTREIEILELLAQGFTNQEIADKLFSSKRTIENHRQRMIEKTDLRNTIALIRYAILNGVI